MATVIPSAEWRDNAACAAPDVSPDLFHPWAVGCGSERDINTTTRRKLARPALAICALCPVRAECLDYAITTRQRDGVWGGMLPHERDKIAKGRRMVSA